MNEQDYGELAPLVTGVGCLLSAALAISLAWRRRAKWEPVEQDVPKGGERVSGLVTAVFLGVMWTQWNTAAHTDSIVRLAMWAGGVTVISLLIYAYLIALQTYAREVAVDDQRSRSEKVIGGFRLRGAVQQKINTTGDTVQQAFAKSAYDVDIIWTRPSRALAKVLMVAVFMLLVTGGSMAVSAAALLFLL